MRCGMEDRQSIQNEYSVRPILLTKIDGPKAMYTYLMNWSERITSGCGAWFVEGSSRRILVDTGRESTASFLAGAGPIFEKVQTIEDGLGHLGLEPADIDVVILTHLHGDHVELARRFPKATFVVQKAELEFAYRPRGVSAAIPYRKELFEGLRFEVVDGDVQILPGISVLLTPGHSPGGQSVAIRTGKGLAVITGFCCIRENLDPPGAVRHLMPVITPGVHVSTVEVDESCLRVKEVADIIVPVHDIEFLRKETIPD
jgi:glyoxylase-like metal-dependent hydrolase (beta-lactamase superfamily II)